MNFKNLLRLDRVTAKTLVSLFLGHCVNIIYCYSNVCYKRYSTVLSYCLANGVSRTQRQMQAYAAAQRHVVSKCNLWNQSKTANQVHRPILLKATRDTVIVNSVCYRNWRLCTHVVRTRGVHGDGILVPSPPIPADFTPSLSPPVPPLILIHPAFPRGNPAIVRSIPRGIPATFIPTPAGNLRIPRDSRRPHPRAHL